MLVLHNDWGALHIGYGISENEIPNWYQMESFFTQNFLAFLMHNRGFYSIWNAWVEKRKEEEFGSMLTIFDGHATHSKGMWVINKDRGVRVPIQEFVDEQDGIITNYFAYLLQSAKSWACKFKKISGYLFSKYNEYECNAG